MITHVMVNADNNNGYKWVSYREWLQNYLQLTPAEINIAIKRNDAKLG